MKKFFAVAVALALGSVVSVQAQKYGETPEDSLNCLKNLSVYQEFYKQNNFSGAYEAWKQVLELCPATSQNTYIRGNVILKNMIAKTKDPALRARYAEELMKLWDMRMQYYGRPGYCLGMKALDMRVYMPSKIKEALDLYNQAMEYSYEAGFTNIPYYYFEGNRDAFKAGLIDKETLIAAYDRAVTVLEEIAAKNPADTVPAYLTVGINAMFEPYATCEDLIPIYTKKFETSSSDVNFLKKATRMLNMRSCTDADIFFKMTEALYKLEPTPQSAYLMARMCYSKSDYAQAVAYLSEEVISQLNAADQENAYLLVGDASLKISHYSDGRRACNKVLELNPNNGRAYILLGSLYAAGATACPGDGTPIATRAPYWAAVDMFYRAKSVEPSLGEMVDKLVATYSAHFPSADDLFTYGLKEGGSYTISCWFTHTTTIRASR